MVSVVSVGGWCWLEGEMLTGVWLAVDGPSVEDDWRLETGESWGVSLPVSPQSSVMSQPARDSKSVE